jgi:hypothetical protein
MPNTLLSRPMRIVQISLAVSLYLVASAQAQHGGFGGGHFGGGHSGGGGHSSHANASAGHTAGHHWGWLHFGSRKRSSRDQSLSGNTVNELRPAEMIGSGNRLRAIPSTYISTIPLRSPLSSSTKWFSTYAGVGHHPDHYSNHWFVVFHPVPTSGCFYNGFNQVCFFQPAWPLFWFSAGFSWFPFGWGSSGDYGDTSDVTGSADMTAAPAMDSEPEASPNVSNNNTIAAQPIRGLDLDPRFFLLILKNGAERVVTDYWLTDGYIEYVSSDGSRSHIPVEALDLEETVRNNTARGLSFVLRSAP